MQRRNKLLLTALSLVLYAVAAQPGWSQMGGGCSMGGQAGHGTKHDGDQRDHAESGAAQRAILAPHGGVVHLTKEFQFETVFTELGARVYFLTADGAVASAREVEGTVVFKPEKGKKAEVPLKWTAGTDDPVAKYRVRPDAMANQSAGFLWAAYDFRAASDGTVQAEIQLRDLSGEDEKKAKWTEPFRMTPLFGMACPMHPDQASLEAGRCAKCGMDLQPAYVFYEASAASGDIRRTIPGTCEECVTELKLKAVGGQETASQTSQQPRPAGHTH